MRVLTIIPTYNELESLPKTLGRLRAAVPASDVLVVDDNSPDGTGQLADRIAAEDSQVHVLHRAGQGRTGRRLHRRLQVGPRRGLRRPGGNGCRRFAPARAAAAAP